MTIRSQSSRAAVRRGLIIAALLIVASAVLRLLSPDYLSQELARRMLGALLGLAVVIYANLVPKAITPIIRMCSDPVAEQAMRRFTGWSLALGGVAYAVTWIIAPLQYTSALSISLLAASVLLVVVRIALGVSGVSRA